MAKKRQSAVNTNPQSVRGAQFEKVRYFSWSNIICVLILVTASIFVYSPSLKVPFLLDDYGKIIRNPDIKSLSNIPSRLVYPYESPPEFHRNDPSRPLTYLTLTLDYHFTHLEPRGFHITNIAIHSIVVLLIFILSSQLFALLGISSLVPPYLTALLFAVHPIHVNVVTYIIGRAASLAAVFYLSAIIFFIRHRQRIKFSLALSVFSFAAALGANQLAMTLPAIIWLVDFCFFSAEVKKNWKPHLAYWITLVLYFGLRQVYFGAVGDLEAAAITVQPLSYFLTQCAVLWKYLAMIFYPVSLSFEHSVDAITHLTDTRFIGAAALYSGLIIMWIAIRKVSAERAALFLFSVLWFVITLSPTSSFFPTTALMAENRLYLPSIGIGLILVYFISQLFSHLDNSKRYIYPSIILIPCVILLANITYRRNILYQNHISIWSDVIAKYPTHQRAHKNLAVEYSKVGKYEEMAKESEVALSLKPDDFDAKNNLAVAYFNLQRYPEALKAYEDIIKTRPDYAPAYSNMGLLKEEMKDVAGAAKAYAEAIRLNPNLIEPLNNLASIYLEQGRLKEAKALYEAALKIDPNHSQIRKNYEMIR